ncbi:hypothetical protein [Fodinibius sp. SL11]|uniref:hypothetical protein n=1 Tax=Fodinibius sp. SL11 TaxID=3425690 RepID=UPI003F884FB6
MKKITFERNELYEKVWEKPVSHLTDELEISSHKLYKACEELDIPTPSAGYWAKLRHDKEVTKPELPESDKESFTLTIREESRMQKEQTKPTKQISVSKRLTQPHPLIKQARKNIDKTSLNRYNRVRGGTPLDLSVGPDNVERSLRILDALLKEIEEQGYNLTTKRKNKSYWMLIGNGQDEVYFQLREKGNRTEVSDDQRWPEYEYTPIGELQLALFRETYDRTGKVLSDTKSKKLEDRLGEFFIKLEQVMEQVKKRRLEREEYHRKQRKKREIKEAAKERRNEEKQRRNKLKKRATTFTKSQYIYDFIAEIEKQQTKLDLTREEELKFKAWIMWATNHADRLNPVKQTVNEILK